MDTQLFSLAALGSVSSVYRSGPVLHKIRLGLKTRRYLNSSQFRIITNILTKIDLFEIEDDLTTTFQTILKKYGVL